MGVDVGESVESVQILGNSNGPCVHSTPRTGWHYLDTVILCGAVFAGLISCISAVTENGPRRPAPTAGNIPRFPSPPAGNTPRRPTPSLLRARHLI